MLYIVTVKLAGTHGHDPLNKVTAMCPMGDEMCTDQTGKHHSFLVQTDLGIEDVRTTYEGQHHVTRIETAANLEVL